MLRCDSTGRHRTMNQRGIRNGGGGGSVVPSRPGPAQGFFLPLSTLRAQTLGLRKAPRRWINKMLSNFTVPDPALAELDLQIKQAGTPQTLRLHHKFIMRSSSPPGRVAGSGSAE